MPTRRLTYLQAVNEGLHQILDLLPEAYLLGEDVGAYGGGFGATAGLIEKYPERVLETPISEAAITGIATGSAIMGKRPILEIQFSDFLTVAIDQLVNEAAKIHYLSNGQEKVPMVIRTASGSGTGAGPQHSQSLENWLAHIPGLIVAMPSNPYDAKGILLAAVKNNNPVIIFEPKSLYKKPSDIDVPEEAYEVKLGRSKLVKEGSDLTVIALGRMVDIIKNMDLNPSLNIVDPVTISPLDISGLLKEANKTGKVLILTESIARSGISAEIFASLCEAGFKGDIKRLGGKFSPVSAAKTIEENFIPTEKEIREAIEELMHED
ncbi:alpha-ketoacid dehydrogenase subunit beta [Streptococcaceae bacterium ESL0729]|nr:alpha-ketoacid dehydrogenase subunit beta [Streptococcaceae bacterium ESL0729]